MANSEPFLKWAGGKRWLVKQHFNMLPKFDGAYIEPFLGSGAMFFHLAPKNSHLSDKNAALIETYSVVRDFPHALHRRLTEMHFLHDSEFYYRTRESEPATKIERAARFIYLNRTCWNGLYRVNAKGKFNVPIGTKTEVMFPAGVLSSISTLLKGVTIVQLDFESAIDQAVEGDFVFVDPPYTVSHNSNGFIKYNDVLFSWSDQIRLSKSVLRASERGAKIFVSNANHQEVIDLYSDFMRVHILNRASVLSGRIEARKGTTEAAFLNYE